MMKSLFTTALLLAGIVACQAQILGEPVVHWDFADGIPVTFTNSGVGGAIWEYRGPNTTPDNTVCSQGSCGVDSEPIESITTENGFVIFDSAWWDDNDGSCNGNGGPVEGPHDAELITGSIDCSSHTSLVFTYQQYVKHYQNTTKVFISTDGGQVWTEIHDNGGWYIITDLDEWVSINVSDLAAGQSDVRFKFQFQGDHYWWCVDDVVLYVPNENDMQLVSTAYTEFDFDQEPDGYGDIAYHSYPESMLRPLNFSCRARNIGGLPQTNVGAQFVVTRDGMEVINNADNAGTANPGSIKTMSLPSWTPPGIGDYEVSYTVFQDEFDENLDNNSGTLDFSVHPFEFAQDEGVMEGQYLGIEQYYESAFEMGNMFESWEAGLHIHSVGFALGDSTDVGTVITGRVYDRDDSNVILGETAPYTVNAWDLNSIGDSKWVWLPLETPIVTLDTTLYWGVVHHEGGPDIVRIGQSGIPEEEITILAYPDDNALFYMPTTPMVRLGIFEIDEFPGCVDAMADNYDSMATIDDGSCRYAGCTFENSLNFDPTANFDDGSCQIIGCTDPNASNYDPDAIQDDGSCEYEGCTDPEADNYDVNANVDDGSCEYSGCTDPEADNYDEQATTDDGSCEYLGCTDPEADNYDETANVDDGSCEYFGCTNPDADNYDPEANVDDGSCIVSGCTDPEADNYDETANNDDGSCFYLGCMDPEADNYDPTATVDDGNCEYWGCTDPNALNYDAEANTNDGSCQYAEAFFSVSEDFGCGTLELTVTNQTAGTEAGACSFDMDDGTVYFDCAETFSHTYTETGSYTITYTFVVSDVATEYSIEVNVYPVAITPEIAWDNASGMFSCANCSGDESLIWELSETTVGEESTYSPSESGDYFLHLTDTNGCTGVSEAFALLLGCMDPFALNYNEMANGDDGSCMYPEADFTVSATSGCAPFMVTVTDNTTHTGGTCIWEFGEELVIPAEQCGGTLDYTYQSAGDFTITYTYTAGDWISTAEVYITVYPPAVQPEIAFDDPTGILSCTNCTGDMTLTWWLNGSALNEDSESWMPSETGDYQLQITDGNGCMATSEELAIIVDNIYEYGAQPLTLYPNPASDRLTVQTPVADGGLWMTDLQGRVVLNGPLATGLPQSLEVESLAAGTYLLVWETATVRQVVRVEVVH